jgi:hypothetical protein
MLYYTHMPTATQSLSIADQARMEKLIEELIGIPYRNSPEATSAALLYHLHNRPGGKRLEVTPMPRPALIRNLETDLMWMRPLTDKERAAPYIVAYDVNAAYLAACSALPLGVGEPRHIDGSDIGLWAQHPGYFLWNAQTWITTPTFMLALEQGRALNLTEAWVWPGHSRPLEPWYKVLRDARQSLMDRRLFIDELPANRRDRPPMQIVRADPPVFAALQTIKKMYTGFIGRLCSTNWDRTNDPLYRPDWRHMIIATRRARLQRVMAQTDPAPFAAYSDCLYFAAEQQVTGLKMGTNPGSFKIHGTEKNEGDVRAAIDAGDLQQLVRLVKQGTHVAPTGPGQLVLHV